MQIKFNILQAEQFDSSGDFRSRLATSSLVFARSLAVDLWQVYDTSCREGVTLRNVGKIPCNVAKRVAESRTDFYFFATIAFNREA